MKKLRLNKKEVDDLFREVIRGKYKSICVNCQSPYKPQVAHIISRSYYTTRWDIENAVILCLKCHMKFTSHPLEWEQWIIKRIGQEEYEALKRKALSYKKINYRELAAILSDQL